jgi:S-disulfanyl-L-cysteine oxidoreductase SoxD
MSSPTSRIPEQPIRAPSIVAGALTALLIGWLIRDAGAQTGVHPMLGRPIAPDEIRAISINAFPDGSGLPSGRGDARQGQTVFERSCASCHGPKGIGGSAEELAGANTDLRSETPDKTIGTYWPYATTVFDFVRRAMPLDAPRSLSDDQVYAATAYLLFLNGLIGIDQEMNAQTLPAVRMPNRDGFIDASGTSSSSR